MNMTCEIENSILEIAQHSRAASRKLSGMCKGSKNDALQKIAHELESNRKFLIEENEKDLEKAKEDKLSDAMIDRLRLTHERIDGMAQGLRQLIDLPDPVGQIIEGKTRPNGLNINKVRTPIGVIGIIYESRPNVTIDCAGLCLKSGNAAILRGGKEALYSNRALASVIENALKQSDIPAHAVQLIPTTDREALNHLLTLDEYVHCIIPRGGEGLIRFVSENSRIPVIKHYKGVCNLYLDEGCDAQMAQDIAVSAKCGRPGVCNAIENLIVHQSHLPSLLPKIAKQLTEKGCKIFADDQAKSALGNIPTEPSTDAEYAKEFLDLRIAIKTVDSVDDAIAFINQFGSGHSESILTSSKNRAEKFQREVDASSVYWNASTRFTDGFEFGLGAEIGISTDRLHARGPMGLEELCTYKFIIEGDGQWK
jgi:glutamate-5-semialdehyde dehydrogenase